MTDFTLRFEGSIYILHPHTPAAAEWIDEYIPDDALAWGKGIVVEPRYIEPIVQGILADGLEVA